MKRHSITITLCYLFFLSCSFFLYQFLAYPEGHKEIDSPEYEIIARNYAITTKLVNPHYPHQMPSHTLGYHWFLGTVYKLFGIDAINALIIIQLILALLCCTLLYGIAAVLFNSTIALVTLVISVTNLGLIIYPQLVMAEMLMITLLIGFLYFFIRFLENQTRAYLIISALSLSLSVLVKPVAIYFLVPLFFGIWLFKPSGIKKWLNKSVLFAFVFYCPLAAYMSYNYYKFNKAAITTLVEENLYIYFLPRRILSRLPEQERTMHGIEITTAASDKKMEISREIFHTILRTKPHLFVFAWIESMIKIMSGLHATQLKGMFNSAVKGGSCSFFAMKSSNIINNVHNYIVFGAQNNWLKIISYLDALWLLLRYLFVMIGLLTLFYAHAYYLTYFCISYCGYFIFVGGHDGCARYRMMIEPILILLAAVGVYTAYMMIRNRKQSLSMVLTTPTAS